MFNINIWFWIILIVLIALSLSVIYAIYRSENDNREVSGFLWIVILILLILFVLAILLYFTLGRKKSSIQKSCPLTRKKVIQCNKSRNLKTQPLQQVSELSKLPTEKNQVNKLPDLPELPKLPTQKNLQNVETLRQSSSPTLTQSGSFNRSSTQVLAPLPSLPELPTQLSETRQISTPILSETVPVITTPELAQSQVPQVSQVPQIEKPKFVSKRKVQVNEPQQEKVVF